MDKSITKAKRELAISNKKMLYDEMCRLNIDNAQLSNLDFFLTPDKLAGYLIYALRYAQEAYDETVKDVLRTVTEWCDNEAFKQVNKKDIIVITDYLKLLSKRNIVVYDLLKKIENQGDGTGN